MRPQCVDRLGLLPQQKPRTVPLEARVTATWNGFCFVVVLGGLKALQDRKCFTTRKPRSVSLFSDCFVQRFSTLQPERVEAPTFDGVLDLAGWNCVLCDCPCTLPLPRILVWGTPAHARWSPA
jgi:hypothetical protein